MDYLARRLKAAGPAKWPEIAAKSGAVKSLLRKIAYGDRKNPGVETIQQLLTYLRAQEEADLAAAATAAAAAGLAADKPAADTPTTAPGAFEEVR